MVSGMSSVSPAMSFDAASQIIRSAAAKMSDASMSPDTSSNLPCPNSCCVSAGSADILTEKKAMIAARRSIPEWIASEIILTEPIQRPTAILSMKRPVLDIIESLAVFFLRSACMFGLDFVSSRHGAFIIIDIRISSCKRNLVKNRN